MRLNATDAGFEYGAWRVTLDDADVTDLCREANDTEGYVDLMVRDANGRIEIRGNEVKLERLRGTVHIERRVASYA